MIGFRESELSFGGRFVRILRLDGTAQYELGVASEARRSPWATDPMGVHGGLDVGLAGARVVEDAGGAGLSNRGVGLEHLLHHRPDDAGELGELALEEVAAEVDRGRFVSSNLCIPTSRYAAKVPSERMLPLALLQTRGTVPFVPRQSHGTCAQAEGPWSDSTG